MNNLFIFMTIDTSLIQFANILSFTLKPIKKRYFCTIQTFGTFFAGLRTLLGLTISNSQEQTMRFFEEGNIHYFQKSNHAITEWVHKLQIEVTTNF